MMEREIESENAIQDIAMLMSENRWNDLASKYGGDVQMYIDIWGGSNIGLEGKALKAYAKQNDYVDPYIPLTDDFEKISNPQQRIDKVLSHYNVELVGLFTDKEIDELVNSFIQSKNFQSLAHNLSFAIKKSPRPISKGIDSIRTMKKISTTKIKTFQLASGQQEYGQYFKKVENLIHSCACRGICPKKIRFFLAFNMMMFSFFSTGSSNHNDGIVLDPKTLSFATTSSSVIVTNDVRLRLWRAKMDIDSADIAKPKTYDLWKHFVGHGYTHFQARVISTMVTMALTAEEIFK